jgi:hypothetical protein
VPIGVQTRADDDNDKGASLDIRFTVDDAKMFAMPWSAKISWRCADGWVENVYAQNTFEYYINRVSALPKADKPDF